MNILLLAAGILCGFILMAGYRRAEATSSYPRRRTCVKVSIIVPARDEERNLPSLLQSLRNQTMPPYEVIVVDDGSSDSTAEIARDWGADVVQPGEIPAGWIGKSWACWQGARHAKGDYFIFLDADICLAETALESMLADRNLREGLGILTVQPYHIVRQPYEQLSAFFNLIVLMSVGPGNDRTSGKLVNWYKAGAFGPCLALARAVYFQSGGHEAVRSSVLEHFTMSGIVSGLGLAVSNRIGKGMMSFRMYSGGCAELLRGWAKSFASGAARTQPLRLGSIIVWIAGAGSGPAIGISGLIHHNVALFCLGCSFYALYACQLAILVRRIGNFRLYTALLYPVPLAAYLLVFAYSILLSCGLGQNSWKGRALPVGWGRNRR
ncbi:glycosyltransferase family 2 protein [Paenibacillus chungangensis]|uniref:4,4'-diaponeurosporenoate glycosyltransferase n=1 Tax=Paenibacillus chungangensis TaxID=696535 RepID=A0ABW3HLM3_9BACL